MSRKRGKPGGVYGAGLDEVRDSNERDGVDGASRFGDEGNEGDEG
jgi:hypothetical protein